MNKVFSIGDIHGEITKFKKLLEHWHPATQQLIILGDLVDRGENPLETIRLAKKLHEESNAIVLMGNHEEMFLDWLNKPEMCTQFYYKHGGMATIDSFFGYPITRLKEPGEIASLLKQQFQDEIEFLATRPIYYEWHNYVFVHAGVNLELSNWKDSTQEDCLWIRSEFHNAPNTTGKTFIFGHTPTNRLHPDQSHDIWVSPCDSKIGIDGGAVFNGLLHGLTIDIETNTKHIHTITQDFDSLIKELRANHIA